MALVEQDARHAGDLVGGHHADGGRREDTASRDRLRRRGTSAAKVAMSSAVEQKPPPAPVTTLALGSDQTPTGWDSCSPSWRAPTDPRTGREGARSCRPSRAVQRCVRARLRRAADPRHGSRSRREDRSWPSRRTSRYPARRERDVRARAAWTDLPRGRPRPRPIRPPARDATHHPVGDLDTFKSRRVGHEMVHVHLFATVAAELREVVAHAPGQAETSFVDQDHRSGRGDGLRQ